MATYETGYPNSNGLAVPPVMSKPVELSGRLRVAYGYVLAVAGAAPGDADVVNLNVLPVGARILAVLLKWGTMNDGTDTLQLRVGTTAISAAKDGGTPQTAFAFDYTGVGHDVVAGEENLNVLLSGNALDGAITEKFEAYVLYALD